MNVQHNTAKLAKEKGFIVETIDQIHNTFYDEEGTLDTLPYYMNHYDMNDFYMEEGVNSCLAPTQSELQKWLREVHNLFVIIDYNGKFEYTKWFYTIKSDTNQKVFDSGYWETYEKCLEEGLFAALNLI